MVKILYGEKVSYNFFSTKWLFRQNGTYDHYRSPHTAVDLPKSHFVEKNYKKLFYKKRTWDRTCLVFSGTAPRGYHFTIAYLYSCVHRYGQPEPSWVFLKLSCLLNSTRMVPYFRTIRVRGPTRMVTLF